MMLAESIKIVGKGLVWCVGLLMAVMALIFIWSGIADTITNIRIRVGKRPEPKVGMVWLAFVIGIGCGLLAWVIIGLAMMPW